MNNRKVLTTECEIRDNIHSLVTSAGKYKYDSYDEIRLKREILDELNKHNINLNSKNLKLDMVFGENILEVDYNVRITNRLFIRKKVEDKFTIDVKHKENESNDDSIKNN